jgi:hypothetical protein
MYRYELNHFQTGLLFYYFSSIDQNSHMLWGRYDSDLLEIYRAVDTAIGEAVQKAGRDTTLLILSDHGFVRFDRAVHLNTFLMREGFLTLDDPANAGNEELFAHVDWSRTQAYAVGLNAIYLNLQGRENGGIVQPDEKEQVAQQIAGRLKEFKDPVNGQSVVGQVYFPEKDSRRRNLKYAPDILVGFHRGFRASWQTALGAQAADRRQYAGMDRRSLHGAGRSPGRAVQQPEVPRRGAAAGGRHGHHPARIRGCANARDDRPIGVLSSAWRRSSAKWFQLFAANTCGTASPT